MQWQLGCQHLALRADRRQAERAVIFQAPRIDASRANARGKLQLRRFAAGRRQRSQVFQTYAQPRHIERHGPHRQCILQRQRATVQVNGAQLHGPGCRPCRCRPRLHGRGGCMARHHPLMHHPLAVLAACHQRTGLGDGDALDVERLVQQVQPGILHTQSLDLGQAVLVAHRYTGQPRTNTNHLGGARQGDVIHRQTRQVRDDRRPIPSKSQVGIQAPADPGIPLLGHIGGSSFQRKPTHRGCDRRQLLPGLALEVQCRSLKLRGTGEPQWLLQRHSNRRGI